MGFSFPKSVWREDVCAASLCFCYLYRVKTCESIIQWMTWERRGSFDSLAKLTSTVHLSRAQVQSCQLAFLLRKSRLLCVQGDPCQPMQGSQNPTPRVVCRLNAWSHRKGVLVLPNISKKNCFAVITKSIGSICRE